MKLIVGLGNPGIEYQFTPHNAGFLAIDRIAEGCGVVASEPAGTGSDGEGEAGRTRCPAGQAGDVHEPERAFGSRAGSGAGDCDSVERPDRAV